LEKQGQNTSRIEEGSAEKNDQLFALKIVNLPTPFDHYALKGNIAIKKHRHARESGHPVCFFSTSHFICFLV
ncbi:MAG: hypothetical protein WC612_02435, partial [Bdellovibrionales bacterium]